MTTWTGDSDAVQEGDVSMARVRRAANESESLHDASHLLKGSSSGAKWSEGISCRRKHICLLPVVAAEDETMPGFRNR